MEDEINIRPYKDDELLKIIKLTKTAFTRPYKKGKLTTIADDTLEKVKKEIKNGAKIFVAVKNEKIIGTVRYAIRNKTVRFYRLAVDYKYRNKGVGAKLIGKVILMAKEKKCKKVKVEVIEEKGLVPYYSKFDFRKVSAVNKRAFCEVIMELTVCN